MIGTIDHYLFLNLLSSPCVAICINKKDCFVGSLAVCFSSFYRFSLYDNRLNVYLHMVLTLGCNGALRWADGSSHDF